MCIIPCIYLCTKEKRKKRSYCSCSLFFVEQVGGWDLGGEDPSCSRDAGACVVQKEEWGVACSPRASTSPALLLGTQLWLTGSPSTSRRSPGLQRQEQLCCQKLVDQELRALRLGCVGHGGEGSVPSSLSGRCQHSLTVLIATYVAAPAVSTQEPVSQPGLGGQLKALGRGEGCQTPGAQLGWERLLAARCRP